MEAGEIMSQIRMEKGGMAIVGRKGFFKMLGTGAALGFPLPQAGWRAAGGALVPRLGWTSCRHNCGCSTGAAGPAAPPQARLREVHQRRGTSGPSAGMPA